MKTEEIQIPNGAIPETDYKPTKFDLLLFPVTICIMIGLFYAYALYLGWIKPDKKSDGYL